MYNNTTMTKAKEGFTLIELLVVMSIIALLIGILVPGMRGVTKMAKELKQKSYFHNMDVGLNLFREDFGNFPSSDAQGSGGNGQITGAHHLAEAMVGRDGRGFEPTQNRIWNYPGQADARTPDDLYQTDSDDSLERRKELYIDPKDMGLVDLSEIYSDIKVNDGDYTCYDSTTGPAPVFTDVFERRMAETAAGDKLKVGTPIVYFVADDTSSLFREMEDKPSTPFNETTETSMWIYDYQDNQCIFNLPGLKDGSQHKYDFEYQEGDPAMHGNDLFYEAITNPEATRQSTVNSSIYFRKPYNARSFLLISAGWDGIFGTKDDVQNFGE